METSSNICFSKNLISPTIQKLLGDRNTDKRKNGAAEIEKIVKQLMRDNDHGSIRAIIALLKGSSYLLSTTNLHVRKGAVLTFASIAITLGEENADQFIDDLLPSVIKACFDDDKEMRFVSLEALYNILRTFRQSSLPYFPDLFELLIHLSPDMDQKIKSGSEFVDKLLKDIVLVSQSFDIKLFVTLIRERLCVTHSFTRMFLLSWIYNVGNLTESPLLEYLHELLDGLFEFLSGTNYEVQRMTDVVLKIFYDNINQDSPLKTNEIIGITLLHFRQSQKSSQDKLTHRTSLRWLLKLIDQSEMWKEAKEINDSCVIIIRNNCRQSPHSNEIVLDFLQTITDLIDNSKEFSMKIRNDMRKYCLLWLLCLVKSLKREVSMNIHRIPFITSVLLLIIEEEMDLANSVIGNDIIELLSKLCSGEKENLMNNDVPLLRRVPTLNEMATDSVTKNISFYSYQTDLREYFNRRLSDSNEHCHRLMSIITSIYCAECEIEEYNLTIAILNKDDDDYNNNLLIHAIAHDILVLFYWNQNKFNNFSYLIRQICHRSKNAQLIFLAFSIELYFFTKKSILDGFVAMTTIPTKLNKNPKRINRSCSISITEYREMIIYALTKELLTSKEFCIIRQQFRDIYLFLIQPINKNFQNQEIIRNMFESIICIQCIFSYDIISFISICLLCQNYLLSYRIICSMSEYEYLTFAYRFKERLSELVRIIESPSFSFMRLQLVSCTSKHYIDHEHLIKYAEPSSIPSLTLYNNTKNNNSSNGIKTRIGNIRSDKCALTRSLYGLLMLLPQTSSFEILKDRLTCIPSSINENSISDSSSINNEKLELKSDNLLYEFVKEIQLKLFQENN
ncbi:hypothetical protein SNEBB_007300 [Seison nebaliae]|nr:hypothetical protein SNEBB_007300 [Seison nebaliae]